MIDVTHQRPSAGREPKASRPWLAPLVGLAAAIMSLLPWMLTGMRLTLQNLWATDTLPGDMPFVLWPFSQYLLPLVFGISGTAGVAIGLVARFALQSARAAWIAAVVVVGVHGVALAHAAVVAGAGLESSTMARIYLALMIGASIVLIACGAVLARLLCAGRPVATVAATFGALALGTWLNGVLLPPFSGIMPGPFQQTMLTLTPWLPPVLVSLALAWCGLRRASDAVPWALSLAVLYVLPAAITGIMTAVGSRVYWRVPLEALELGASVFAAALTTDAMSRALPSVAIALAVGLVGLAVTVAIGRRRRRAVAASTG